MQMVVPQAHGNRVPSSAAPQKCELEMTEEKFRSWRTSMKMWILLNGWHQTESVCYIRLICTQELQGVLDNRYPIAQWTSMTTDQALAAIGHITVKYSNKAAEKELFYSLRQGPYETVSTFFTRAYSTSTNANFQCPQCKNGLGEYLLLSKLAVGLYDTELRKEIFRAFETITDVNSLRAFCIAHEAATKSATSGRAGMDHVVGHTVVTEHHHEDAAQGESDVIGAIRKNGKPWPKKSWPSPADTEDSCKWCGGQHNRGKQFCAARNATCKYCHNAGHFERVCYIKQRDQNETPTRPQPLAP